MCLIASVSNPSESWVRSGAGAITELRHVWAPVDGNLLSLIVYSGILKMHGDDGGSEVWR